MTDLSRERPSHPPDRPNTFPWPPILFALAVMTPLALERIILRLPVPFAETAPVNFVGVLLLVAGAGLALWAALAFYRHATSIRPDRGSQALIVTGPYAFSRNPIYLGEILILVGAGLAFNRLWLLLAAPAFAFAVTRLAIKREEAYLAGRFGADYMDYSERVRRWL